MQLCRTENTEKSQPCYTDTSGAPRIPGHGYNAAAQSRPDPLQRMPKNPETPPFGGKKS